ncbi:conserved hypothetical protein [Vibrio jasicida]|uniref:Uncharacterized protein n=2 Tax=Vibrio TaxID=662 RepID=A0AAU9QSV6_9VIBR|nr:MULTISPECIES: hypothetical protein [Vibrio]PAW02460.1 hypothetical protein CKJ79_17500 [Vibrio coralliilyticus]POB47203.1 hypothetical protein CRN52_14075 [Vibrio vulnificus]CAH1588280.1 conserved hypothetical protein [Vibrio jasicida]CAH1599867.1 conserved hypothetical protein [Vibrio jasicida]
MCEMQIGTIECRGDGYLWDADSVGYDPADKSMPCPNCNTLVFLENAKEEAESTSYYQDMTSSGTGVTIWENAVKAANYWNPEATTEALPKIGKVEAVYDDPDDKSNTLTQVFCY